MDAVKRAFQESKRNSDVMLSFGLRLRGQFSTNKAYRRPKELEWLESLRQYKGLYDPDVVIEKNASKVYPKITRSKVNIVLSRLHEMLFPEIDKNWEIIPTPDPKLEREQVKQIAISITRQDPETGEIAFPTVEDLRIAIKDYAEKTCASMSVVIDDQLTEMDYPEETKKVLRSGLIYGTGIMKGPMISSRTKRRWKPVQTKDGIDYEEELEDDEVPLLQFVRLWDWYPDMSTTEISSIEGSFERHVMTKHDIRELAKRPDFYSDMINKYLTEHPDGNYTPCAWETDLQVIEVEAGSNESGGRAITSTSVSTDPSDTNRSTYRQLGKKYEVLEYWGYVDGSDLEACGLEVSDLSIEYAANVWVLGEYPIKAKLYSGALNQYKVFYYEKDETSIFGEGLPRVMRHSAIAIGAAARMVLDNASCVAGPQVEVNWQMMTPDTDYTSFYPRKIWFREGRGVDAQYPALRVYNIESHIDELLKIIEAFKQFGDEETTLPTWMIGQMVNNETAQATSGRMATITISIKDVVKNFDAFTEKIIEDVYAWNMDFNPRNDIKGDFKVRARGVSSLVMKEVRMQALTQLSSTLTPAEWDYVPEGELVREKFKAHDLDIKLKTDEEVAKMREERQSSIEMQLQTELLRSEIAKNKSQAMSNLTKAKEKNVAALRSANEPIDGGDVGDERLTQAELAKAETERVAKEREIARQDEKHVMEMQQKMEDHEISKEITTTKAAQDIALKSEQARTGIEIEKDKASQDKKLKKEKAKQDSASKQVLTKASAAAKIITAKKTPAKKPEESSGKSSDKT